jgi:hypothetical protein
MWCCQKHPTSQLLELQFDMKRLIVTGRKASRGKLTKEGKKGTDKWGIRFDRVPHILRRGGLSSARHPLLQNLQKHSLAPRLVPPDAVVSAIKSGKTTLCSQWPRYESEYLRALIAHDFDASIIACILKFSPLSNLGSRPRCKIYRCFSVKHFVYVIRTIRFVTLRALQVEAYKGNRQGSIMITLIGVQCIVAVYMLDWLVLQLPWDDL